MRKLLILAQCALLLPVLVACGKKAEEPIQPAAVAEAASAPVSADITPPEALVAMLRGHPNSRQICIDGARKNAFFLDYGPLQKPGEEQDGRWHGWIFVEKVEFYKTSNDTWFITDLPNYTQVYPDTTGLICKSH